MLVWGFTAGLLDRLLHLGGWERPWTPGPINELAAGRLRTTVFDLLDWILLLAVISFGVSGYRQGFIVGAMSFIGFLGGAILGAKLAPSISSLIGNGKRSPVTGLVVVFLGAALGQLIASAAAAWVRTRIHWRPAQTVDSVGGAVISGISVLLVAWLMATAVNRSPYDVLTTASARQRRHPGGRLAGARQRPPALRELPAPGGAAGLPAGVRRARRRHHRADPPARPGARPQRRWSRWYARAS